MDVILILECSQTNSNFFFSKKKKNLKQMLVGLHTARNTIQMGNGAIITYLITYPLNKSVRLFIYWYTNMDIF